MKSRLGAFTGASQHCPQVGMARCAVPARAEAGGTNVVDRTLAVARCRRLTLRSATGTAQRAIPTDSSVLFRGQCQDAPAFTLIELLAVLAVFILIAGILLPLGGHHGPTTVVKAKTEMAALLIAISAYESAYGHFPVSLTIAPDGQTNSEDFTFGSTIKSPSEAMPVGTMVGGQIVSNSEVIAILMNLTNYPGNPNHTTANADHKRNPQQTKFLIANMVNDSASPGVGPDLVFRDPWGNPYFITMDLNQDGYCQDVFYGKKSISRQAGTIGYYGLTNKLDADGAGNHFQFPGKVMAWSAGPDKKINPEIPANQGENRDNVLSWY